MKYCIKCGNTLQDNANFCDKCRTKANNIINNIPNGNYEDTSNNSPKSNLSNILHKCLTSSFLFTINGRLNRAPYNVLWLIFSAVSIIIPFFGLIFIIPNICITIKRVHDLNLSGWLLLLLYVVLFLLAFPIVSFSLPFISTISCTLIIWFIMFFVSIILMIIKGTTGPNKYGNDLLLTDEENDNLRKDNEEYM